MSEQDFDAKAYAMRVMRGKGYDPLLSDEYAAVFAEQWPSWKEVLERHRFRDEPEKAERLLTIFRLREVKGGAGKILESFNAFLDAQPKPGGGSPSLALSGKEWGECALCDGRGIISDIPSQQDPERVYSWACVCGRGDLFGTIKKAPQYAQDYARDRKKAEIELHAMRLRKYGVNPQADPQTRTRQWRQAFRNMTQQVGSGKATAKTVTPILPQTVEEARALLARKPRKPAPPPHLNPEALALTVYGNGDERNEIQ